MLEHIDALMGPNAANKKNLTEGFECIDQTEHHGKKHAVPHLRYRDIPELLPFVAAV